MTSKNSFKNIIGGEYEYPATAVYSYVTDSGRSSLRLILRSVGRNLKFLLPDFLCEIILKVFEEERISFDFYHVNEDLTIDTDMIKKSRKYDVLYLIDYFGRKDKLFSEIEREDLLIVEDTVFMPFPEIPANAKKWIGFNSLRKISFIADGSIVQSTIKLNGDLIRKEEPKFSRLMREAKNIRYEHIHKKLHSEESYLGRIGEARSLLDRQRKIYSASDTSLFGLFDFFKNIERERGIRLENYNKLDEYISGRAISRLKPSFPTHYVLSVSNRDALRKYLFTKKIFLPVHWPAAGGLKNTLCDKVISIPVDPRYNAADMIKVAKLINKFYQKERVYA